MTSNDQSFRMRMTADEHAMHDALAESERASAAHVVRELIRREHATKLGRSVMPKGVAKGGKS